MKQSLLAPCASLVAVTLSLLAAPAFAQDAKPAGDSDVKDIVVTASSAGKTAQNSSISVTQVSQDRS
jgi:outer membrane receptor protein involved in Fe transport